MDLGGQKRTVAQHGEECASPAALPTVRSELDEIVDHRGWETLVNAGRTSLAIPHVAERILWNHRELLESAAQKEGFLSFRECLDHCGQGGAAELAAKFGITLWHELPRWMLDYETDQRTVLDADNIRYSRFFRYPHQYAWFYDRLRDRLAAEKEKACKSPLKIDLVGPAYFQEPLTLLSLVRAACTAENVRLIDLPFELNVFDKNPLVFEMLREGRLVYRKRAIESDLRLARSIVAEDQNFAGSRLLQDWDAAERALFGLMLPVTHPDSRWQVLTPGLDGPESGTWLDCIRVSVDYEKAEPARNVNFIFVNGLFWYADQRAIEAIAATRLNPDGIVFSTKCAGDLRCFSPHTAMTKSAFELTGAYTAPPPRCR